MAACQEAWGLGLPCHPTMSRCADAPSTAIAQCMHYSGRCMQRVGSSSMHVCPAMVLCRTHRLQWHCMACMCLAMNIQCVSSHGSLNSRARISSAYSTNTASRHGSAVMPLGVHGWHTIYVLAASLTVIILCVCVQVLDCCAVLLPSFLQAQMALGAALAIGSCELLLLLKAVAVAVWAPDMVMPSPSLPGISGLLCTFVALTTSLCSSLVTGLVLRWLIYNRGRPAASKADEESAGAEITRPLLAASWELPENNKRIGAAGKDAEEPEQKPLQPGTVLELVRMTVPDMPVLLFAFLFGVAAALMAACVPYFTGLIIDYASIDPDR